MFVGHYSAALALKAARPPAPLWALFVAVQLVDFAWAGLVMAGVEKVRIVPGFLAASNLDLYFMPYTHSLPGALAWSAAAGGIVAMIWRNGRGLAAGAIVGAAVFSHWALDFIVHAPDLPLYPGGPKVGLGLWNSLVASQAIEIGALAVGMLIYLAATKAKTSGGPGGSSGRTSAMGLIAPLGLFAALVGLQAYSLFGAPPPASTFEFAATALFAYAALAVLAGLVDLTRRAK
ncbi:MAG: hypothetical protein GC152_02755 [Alphaproteobacteria bacterium]|nr:hypothetical protein [Alphaproteobacteria bacterium]